jgi:hypothetical protein
VSSGLYVMGLRMSAFAHLTEVDQGGAAGEDVTDDQTGSPEREIDVTSQPRATADLQMRDPAAVNVVWCWRSGGELG